MLPIGVFGPPILIGSTQNKVSAAARRCCFASTSTYLMSTTRHPSNSDGTDPTPPAVPFVDASETGADKSPAFSLGSLGDYLPTSLPRNSQRSSQIPALPAELRIYAAELTKRCTSICADLDRAEAEVLEGDKPHVSKAADELAIRSANLHMQHEATAMSECLNGLLEEVRKIILLQIPRTLKIGIINLDADMTIFSIRLSELIASTTVQQMPQAAPTTATSAVPATLPTASVEPPPNAPVDHCGRFVDSRYRLWYARKEFGRQSNPPKDFTVLYDHRLNELLEYANPKLAAPEPESEVGLFIQGEFLSLFRLQKAQLNNRTCSLYVRECYVEYRKILMDAADAHQAQGQELACRLTGNPGIGKSTFLVYHLLKLLKEANHNEHADDYKKEKALRLKIFLSDGCYFYVYSRRTGWLQVKEEEWIDMHTKQIPSPYTWLLVDSYDVPETASRLTLSVSSPNIRHYARFAKNVLCVNVLPTWSWDEVQGLFNDLVNVAMNDLNLSEDVRKEAGNRRFVISRKMTHVPSEEEKADDTSEIAEFFAAPAGTVFFLDIKRLRKRFEIWGGVLRKLFSLMPLAGLKSLFKDEKAAKIWKQFSRGDLALFDTATEENVQANIPASNVLHGIFEPVHVQYVASIGAYKFITERGSTALEEWLLSSDWKDLMAKYIEGSNSTSAGDLFEPFCHGFFTCRTDDRSVYLRDCANGPSNYDGALWLDLPKVSERVLLELSDAREPVGVRSKLLYFKPPSPFFKGLDSIFYPGIVVQITVSQARTRDQFATLCGQLIELLKLWGLPKGKKYMVAYVVPGTKFKKFYQMGKGSPIVYCQPHAEEQLACAHCCEQWFDFKVFGIPLPGATRMQLEKLRLNADERWTLNLDGELERKG